MHRTPESVAEIGQVFVEGLVSRLCCELPGRYIANLLHDVGYFDRALTETKTAGFLGVEAARLWQWRSRGGCGLRINRPSQRLVSSRRRDLIAWLECHAVTGTKDPIAGAARGHVR